MNIMTGVGVTTNLAIKAVISGCVGYVYGAFHNLNRNMAATAFAISALVYRTFQLLTALAFKDSPKAFHATHLLGTIAFTTAQIIAFRKLNLIAGLGTGVLATCTFLASLLHLYNLSQALD